MEKIEDRVVERYFIDTQILSRFSSYSCSLNIIQPMREYGVFALYCVCGGGMWCTHFPEGHLICA